MGHRVGGGDVLGKVGVVGWWVGVAAGGGRVHGACIGIQ
jgi:hypothetical protein